MARSFWSRLFGHPSARRARARKKYGLTPRQQVLRRERDRRARAEMDLFYQGRETRYQRMAEAGFPISRAQQARKPRKTARKLRQYGAIRATMRKGYGRR